MNVSADSSPMPSGQVIRLLLLVVVSAWFTVRIFQGFDESIGAGYWVVDRSMGDAGWYGFGLLPHLKTLPRDVVKSANSDADPTNDYLIYAQQGDFAGNDVYGICFGIPLIMFLIWYAFIIGYPDRVDPYLLPRRILTVVIVICCSLVVNFFLLRLSASMLKDPMDRVLNGSGYPASLLFHNAGIWFALLFYCLGTHRPSLFVAPPVERVVWRFHPGGKVSWFLVLIGVVTLVEIIFVQNRLARPDGTADYPLLVSAVFIFVQMFGFSPREWIRKLRGIAILICGTVSTLLIFCVIERVTGTLGAGFASPILVRNFGPEYANVGFSLMLSIHLIFWMAFIAAIRANRPSPRFR